MHPMLNIAVRATCKAGDLIAKNYEIRNSVQQNRSNDIIDNVYKTAKIIIINTIRKYYPKHTILVEENNEYNGCDQNVQWVINPLSGSVNFLKCSPHFTVSVAVRIRERTEVAVVYDPMRNELFTATRGCSAQLNGYRLRSSNTYDINNIVLAIGYPFRIKKYTVSYMKILNKLLTRCIDFRRSGSPSLDLAYVAAGRVDGYFEFGLKPWNFIAGELIARSSGAIVCDFVGSNNYLYNGNIIAGNPRIIKRILAYIYNELNESLID